MRSRSRAVAALVPSLSLCLGFVLGPAASAQTLSPAPMAFCFFAGRPFAVGSMIAADGSVQMCTDVGNWQPATSPIAPPPNPPGFNLDGFF